MSTDTKQCKRETDVVSFLGLWCYLPYRAVRVLLLCVAAVYCRLYRLMSLGFCLVGLKWPQCLHGAGGVGASGAQVLARPWPGLAEAGLLAGQLQLAPGPASAPGP